MIILKMRSQVYVKVTVTQKWYATLRHPKMHSHTKFGISTFNNIYFRDVHRTQCKWMDTLEGLCDYYMPPKVRKRAKIRSRYYQVPHLTQDTNGKVTNSQLDITNESQEVSPFLAGDHKASINRRA